jgi:hypothetical protein
MLRYTDQADGVVCIYHDNNRILTYNYLNSDVYAEEVPKPYFHPLTTLGGSTVTLCRPNDHPWHKGLGMTLTKVGSTNFWGGVTYTKEKGYHWIANHGRQVHQSWTQQQVKQDKSVFAHVVHWENAAGQILLVEKRSFEVSVESREGFWTLDFCSHIQNATGVDLALGTYEASEGLAGSFYTGLFWRIPREFLDYIHTLQYNAQGRVFCDQYPGQEDEIHGHRGRWVALHGSVDTIVKPLTIAMIDTSHEGHTEPRIFFRRNQVGVALPFQGSSELILASDGELRLNYRIVLADGHWEASQIEEYCQSVAKHSPGSQS